MPINDAETFQQFLQTEVVQAPVISVIINLVIAAMLGLWIGHVYIRYGTSLSNRRAFAHNFVLLTMTTMLIITLIQSNIALSLGMIGALSIVRFRSAIKEPEELSYLFLSIAVGLGLGANQRLITLGAIFAISIIIRLKQLVDRRKTGAEQNMYLTISTNRPAQVTLGQIGELLEEACSLHRLKRLDQTKTATEACYLVELKDRDSFQLFESSLRKADDAVRVSLLDFRGGMLGAP